MEAHKNDIVVLIGRAGEDDTIDVFEIAVSSDNDALANAAVTAALKKDNQKEVVQESSQGGEPITKKFAAEAIITAVNEDATNG